MRKSSGLVAALVAAMAAVGPMEAGAQEESNRFGVGFQSSWPSYGISGIFDVSESVSAQAVVGAFGTVTNFSGRGIYRFMKEEVYNLYGFGTAGLWRYDAAGLIDENVLGLGGGAGVEFDWRRILANNGTSFPPLFSTIEVGIVHANFSNYNFSSFSMGGGIHYRF